MNSASSIITGAASAVALLAVATLGHAATLTSQEQALIAGAKKEGAVTIINPLFSDRTSRRMGPAFIKRYGLGSGFKFNNLRKGFLVSGGSWPSFIDPSATDSPVTRASGGSPIETAEESLYNFS